jgi:hypothetical protein
MSSLGFYSARIGIGFNPAVFVFRLTGGLVSCHFYTESDSVQVRDSRPRPLWWAVMRLGLGVWSPANEILDGGIVQDISS